MGNDNLYHILGIYFFGNITRAIYVCGIMGDNKEQSKKKPEVRVRGVAISLNTELANIASHKGLNRNQFLKMELRKLADSFPAYMRESFNPDF